MFPSHDRSAHNKNVGVPTVWDPDSLPPSPDTPAVVFVGAYPSYYEDLHNEPFFQGAPAGALLRHAYIDGIGLRHRVSIYLSNAVRCRTGLGSPDPTDKQRRACRPHLLDDLTTIQEFHNPSPLFVVALGSVASRTLYNKTIRDAAKLNGQQFTLTQIQNKDFPS